MPLNKSGKFEDCCVDEEPLFVVPNRSKKKGRVSLRADLFIYANPAKLMRWDTLYYALGSRLPGQGEDSR